MSSRSASTIAGPNGSVEPAGDPSGHTEAESDTKRALMREFGIGEATLIDVEAMNRRHELQALIQLGATRSFLTHQEINDRLPEDRITEETLEAIISLFNHLGIAVYEAAPDPASLVTTTGSPTPPRDEECGVSFSVVCSKTWEDLESIDQDETRWCGQCSKLVYLCRTNSEAIEAARLGRCITLISPCSTPKTLPGAT